MWTGENGGFRKHLLTAHLHVPAGIAISAQACIVQRNYSHAKTADENRCFHPFSVVSCGWWKTLNVDVNTFMRFQGKENEGFRKRIGVDRASFKPPLHLRTLEIYAAVI